ncbi:hypothetical protein [Lysobacter gummosus]
MRAQIPVAGRIARCTDTIELPSKSRHSPVSRRGSFNVLRAGATQ